MGTPWCVKASLIFISLPHPHTLRYTQTHRTQMKKKNKKKTNKNPLHTLDKHTFRRTEYEALRAILILTVEGRPLTRGWTRTLKARGHWKHRSLSYWKNSEKGGHWLWILKNKVSQISLWLSNAKKKMFPPPFFFQTASLLCCDSIKISCKFYFARLYEF